MWVISIIACRYYVAFKITGEHTPPITHNPQLNTIYHISKYITTCKMGNTAENIQRKQCKKTVLIDFCTFTIETTKKYCKKYFTIETTKTYCKMSCEINKIYQFRLLTVCHGRLDRTRSRAAADLCRCHQN